MGVTGAKRACGTYSISWRCSTMSRRRSRRITVIAVESPPPLPLRPFAMEVLRVLEAYRAAERKPERRQQEDREGSEQRRPGPQSAITG